MWLFSGYIGECYGHQLRKKKPIISVLITWWLAAIHIFTSTTARCTSSNACRLAIAWRPAEAIFRRHKASIQCRNWVLKKLKNCVLSPNADLSRLPVRDVSGRCRHTQLQELVHGQRLVGWLACVGNRGLEATSISPQRLTQDPYAISGQLSLCFLLIDPKRSVSYCLDVREIQERRYAAIWSVHLAKKGYLKLLDSVVNSVDIFSTLHCTGLFRNY